MNGIAKWEDDEVPHEVRRFVFAGTFSEVWLMQSRSLYRSAECLMKAQKGPLQFFGISTALMLAGYAIETLLKAAQIADSNNTREPGWFSDQARDMHSTVHDLNALVDKIGVRVSKQDRRMLSDLSECIMWKGKYPIPLKAKGYKGPAFYHAFEAHLKGKTAIETSRRVSELYKKLDKQIVPRIESSTRRLKVALPDLSETK